MKLRQVEVCFVGYPINGKVPEDIKKGWFHGFFAMGDNEGGIECYAVVELEDGIVRNVLPHRVKFLNNPIIEDV